jgi:hypothetical protein
MRLSSAQPALRAAVLLLHLQMLHACTDEQVKKVHADVSSHTMQVCHGAVAASLQALWMLPQVKKAKKKEQKLARRAAREAKVPGAAAVSPADAMAEEQQVHMRSHVLVKPLHWLLPRTRDFFPCCGYLRCQGGM